MSRQNNGLLLLSIKRRGILLEYEEFRKRIVELQTYWSLFKVEFLDRDAFKRFALQLSSQVKDWTNICITGYFSETIRNEVEALIRLDRRVRLICPDFPINSKRDKRNLQALKHLADAGTEIKVNNRLHARFLVAHTSELKRGLLVIGSFDFNTECIGRERYDAGIKTKHPDLVSSAVKFFEQVWNAPESKTLNERYKLWKEGKVVRL